MNSAPPRSRLNFFGRVIGTHAANSINPSQIGDRVPSANVQRAHHLTEFAARDIAVGSFVGRIFFAESFQVKPTTKFRNRGFGLTASQDRAALQKH